MRQTSWDEEILTWSYTLLRPVLRSVDVGAADPYHSSVVRVNMEDGGIRVPGPEPDEGARRPLASVPPRYEDPLCEIVRYGIKKDRFPGPAAPQQPHRQ